MYAIWIILNFDPVIYIAIPIIFLLKNNGSKKVHIYPYVSFCFLRSEEMGTKLFCAGVRIYPRVAGATTFSAQISNANRAGCPLNPPSELATEQYNLWVYQVRK